MCEKRPYVDADVRVGTLRGRTDATGTYRANISPDELLEAAPPYQTTVNGSEVAVANNGLSTAYVAAAENRADVQQKRDEATRQARDVRAAAAEVASGKCSAENRAFFDKYLDRADALMSRVYNTHGSTLIKSQIWPAKPQTQTYTLTFQGSGRIELLAVSRVTLDVELKDGSGVIQRHSELERLFRADGIELESRTFRGAPGEPMTLRIGGMGCALLMTFGPF